MRGKVRKVAGVIAGLGMIVFLMAEGGTLPWATPALASTSVQVSIDAPNKVSQGSDFIARVEIGEVKNFDACNYDVSVDAGVLRLDDVTDGQIGGISIPADMWNEISPGTYGIVQNVPGLAGVSGSGYLAELHLHVIGSGGDSSNISLSNGALSNNVAGKIPATWIGAKMSVILTGAGDGGWSPAASPLPEPKITHTSNITDADGFFTENAVIKSGDSAIKLTIGEGTQGLTKKNEPLSEISIVQIIESPPAPPESYFIISPSYALEPDGASFDPPIELTFTYDPSDVPQGISEEDLVIAWWDTAVSEWIKLEDSIVDITAHTITASVSHFTAFTILASIPASPIPIFTISDPVISPLTVEVGEDVTISVVVSNIGSVSGSCNVTLKIDGSIETKTVEVAAGDSTEVSFTVSRDMAGTYSVDVNGKTGSFTVTEELAPASTQTAPESTQPAQTSPELGKQIKWPILWGVIGAIVMVGAIAIFFRVRRRF